VGLTVSGLYRVYASVTFASLILGRLFAQVPDQAKSKEAAISSLNIINRKSKIDSMSDEGFKPESVKGEIKFENVHFKYPTRPNKVLKGLNLKINPNETTALVGQSGCGKSTTIQLLLRFYDIKKGKITLDGIDIKDLNIKWLRSQIGLVSQEPVLFNYSIKTNIMFGDISRDDVIYKIFSKY
jgi:ABC-type multidrug transport system fused ATPase/permease subunit